MCGGQRGLLVIADLFVKLVVLLLGDVFFGARPQRCSLVDGFPRTGKNHFAGLIVFAVFPLFFRHLNRQRNMVRVLVDHALELPGVQVVLRVRFEVQRDAGAALKTLDLGDLKLARAFAGPAYTLRCGQARTAAFHSDAVCDDKTRIKPHAKLANQLRIVFLIARQLVHEVARAAFGDGAEVVNGFLLRQTDAVVGDRERFGGLVETDTHLELRVGLIEASVVERLKTQLVASIRCVGDQLAQKNLRVGVERVRDQLEELGDFGLEREGL